ncbi:MAG: amidohydrolase, partial [Gemmatimonadota bacterium]|nr:amidohydrolase [Gemmatimonadota bacterium]
PVYAVHPGLAHRERVIREARDGGAVAVRCDPGQYGIEPTGPAMRRIVSACGEAGLPLVLTVKLEDVRQRHPLDTAPELTSAAVRALARVDPRTRLLVSSADRTFIEEVHFGSTPDEASRVWWDIGWIWGPPEDHLALLLRTVGPERFVFGSARPLRIPESARVKLDLIDDDAMRALIARDNAERLAG